MSTVYDELDETLIGFIRRQKLFFVATAPLSAEGSVNISPKGYESLAIIDPRTVAYVDLGGSGIETHAHLRENSRVTLMFCAFEGPANILRLYGRGETCSFDEPGFAEKMKLYKGERDQLRRWVVARPDEEWAARRYEANAVSIDGLPGLTPPER
jgi:hypothetical protein